MSLEYIPNADLYEALEVRADATLEEIIAAHRRLIKLCHPDTGGDDFRAGALNYARDVLSDPDERRLYDQLRAEFGERHSPSPVAPPTATQPTPSANLASELFSKSIAKAFESGDWLDGAILVALAAWVQKAASDASSRDPVVRSAVDALAEWLRATRLEEERRARLALSRRKSH